MICPGRSAFIPTDPTSSSTARDRTASRSFVSSIHARIFALSWTSALLALPTYASALSDEWRLLHARCADAVTAGAPLDVSGLVPLGPALLTEPVTVDLIPPADDGPAIPRVTDPDRIGGDLADTNLIGRQRERQAGRLPSQAEVRDALRPDPSASDDLTLFPRRVAPVSARTVPLGPWAAPGGTLRLQLLEYPTRPGSRTICEVVTPPRTDLSPGEGEALAAAFRAWRDDLPPPWDTADFAGDRLGALHGPNGRGCDVVASFTFDDGRLRSSVGERAGDPACGGASLVPRADPEG